MSGKLFVVEGIDGAGKQTQSLLLHGWLASRGLPVMKVSYPRYSHESAALVKMYLAGDFGGDPNESGPYIPSVFFACDRYCSYKTEFGGFYSDGGIVIADRYVSANMIHQACKIQGEEAQDAYLEWLRDLEFGIFGIPEPTQVFFLDVPSAPAMTLIEGRTAAGAGAGKARMPDIHEKNASYMAGAYETAIRLCVKYGWERISCVEEGIMLPVEIIHGRITSAVEKYL